jgi:hypothetical protein
VSATSPGSTGTPCAAKSSFAWYSYRSTNHPSTPRAPLDTPTAQAP